MHLLGRMMRGTPPLQVGRPRIGAAPSVRSDELWLSKRLVQDSCEPHAGLAKLQRHILSGPGHIVV